MRIQNYLFLKIYFPHTSIKRRTTYLMDEPLINRPEGLYCPEEIFTSIRVDKWNGQWLPMHTAIMLDLGIIVTLSRKIVYLSEITTWARYTSRRLTFGETRKIGSPRCHSILQVTYLDLLRYGWKWADEYGLSVGIINLNQTRVVKPSNW